MSTTCLHIDGSQGEGGGQMVRSALALALVTGRAVEIANIRAGRKQPGLLRQHLAAVRAAVEVGAAEVAGNVLHSRYLLFRPQAIRPGRYSFSVGSAGSATLVLQTVLPALLIADAPSELTLEGGTHNPWAPPFDFLASAFFPLVERFGPRVTAGLERYGFYPAGGGRFSVEIQPAGALRGLELMERGAVRSRTATAIVANLPRHIAQREVDRLAAGLDWPANSFHVRETADAIGPGNVLLVELACDEVCEVFTSFGRRGVRAEAVADEALAEVNDYLATDAPVGPHLADQLLLPLAIAAWQSGQASRFRTLPLTGHAKTQIDVLRMFLDVTIRVESDGGTSVVSIAP